MEIHGHDRFLIKKKDEPDAKLKTTVFIFGNAMQGPVGLFGERVQLLYDYKITSQDKIGKRPVVIVDSTPRSEDSAATNLYGKAWIDAETCDILKIEWSEKRVGRRILGIRIETTGLEKLDPVTPHVFMSNHVSFLDGPLLVTVLGRPVRVIVKRFVFRVPVLGLGMHFAG